MSTKSKKGSGKEKVEKLDIKDFAQRLSKGEKLTDPNHLQFYDNNKTAIESELQVIKNAAGNSSTPAPIGSAPISSEIIFNPLDQPVSEKVYSGVGANGQQQMSDIPEPTYQPAPDESSFIPQKEITKKEQKQIDNSKKAETGNPALANASETEKYEGAAALATVVLTTWEQGYAGLNQLFVISEKKVNKMQQAGQIDVRVEVPYKMGVEPLSNVLRDYNNDASKLLVLEPEFKEAVHPLMTEEFAKSGHGMSNRGQLIFLVTTKLAADAMKAAQFISLKKDYLKFAREATASSRRVAPRLQTANQVIAEPPPQQEQGNEEVINQDGPVDTTGMTMQEAALVKLGPPGGVNNQANFGSPAKLSTLNREYEKTKKQTKSSAGSKKVAASHIANAKKGSNDPVPTSGSTKKRGRGRPPGAKNKKK